MTRDCFEQIKDDRKLGKCTEVLGCWPRAKKVRDQSPDAEVGLGGPQELEWKPGNEDQDVGIDEESVRLQQKKRDGRSMERMWGRRGRKIEFMGSACCGSRRGVVKRMIWRMFDTRR